MSPVSVTYAELFTSSSPSQCSPVPHPLADTGKAALPLRPRTHGGAPGAHAEGRLPAPARASGEEQPPRQDHRRQDHQPAAGPPAPCPGGRQGVLAVLPVSDD